MEAIIILCVLLALSIALNVALCYDLDVKNQVTEETDYEKMVESEKQAEIEYLKKKKNEKTN